MPTLNRRDFLKSCCAGAVVAGVGPGVMRLAFAEGNAGASDTLVVVFMRGGCDGLSLVPPTGGADRGHYEQARPDLQIPLSGTGAALPLGNSNGLWGLHPNASGLRDLYNAGHLAVVLGTGMPAPVTRSHFDAQATMELGTPGQQGIGSGWLTRHMTSMGLTPDLAIPGVSAGSMTATSLISGADAITMGSGNDFRIDTSAWGWNARDQYSGDPPAGLNGLVETLPALWSGNSLLHEAGRHTLESLAVIRPMDFDNYTPANGASYPNDGFADQLQMLAQLIKAGVGLKIATIDLASWDTHNGQDYQFNQMTTRLSQSLTAFYTDLAGSGGANHADRTSIVVMSEFGRRVRQNGSNGTDHGYGNVMLALGGKVNGGQVYGLDEYAGLDDSQLFEGEDVPVTIDYRQVLSEAMIRRQGNNHLGYVFPGYSSYSPLGIFQGSDLPPDYSATGWDELFTNGFD
ncbi:MAG: DUF1501 domain-containing protein [Rhodanobacteraceae bacterium]